MKYIHIKKKNLSLAKYLIILFISTTIVLADKNISKFYLDYAIVEHSLKNDKGNFKELMELVSINSKNASFIASFWWNKAKKECYDSTMLTIKEAVKQMKPNQTKDENSKMKKEIAKKVDQCYYSIYYDHWDEIN